LVQRECAVSFDAKAAAPRKSDGSGAPPLPWAHDWRSRAVVRQQPFEK